MALDRHRSFGGIRTRVYNGVEEASVDALVSFMMDLEEAKGYARTTGAGATPHPRCRARPPTSR